MLYVDRDGNPISVLQWAALGWRLRDRTIAQDETEYGTVLTVWTGIEDERAGILPFGTALIRRSGVVAEDEQPADSIWEVGSYRTRADAVHQHQRLVEQLRYGHSGLEPGGPGDRHVEGDHDGV